MRNPAPIRGSEISLERQGIPRLRGDPARRGADANDRKVPRTVVTFRNWGVFTLTHCIDDARE